MSLPLRRAMVAGWINRHQQQIIPDLHEENRVLKARLRGRRSRLTDTDRRRLAALARPLGRQRLTEIATMATPDTLLRWYRWLIAQQFDGRDDSAMTIARRRNAARLFTRTRARPPDARQVMMGPGPRRIISVQHIRSDR
jgi:hypothetical protein